MGSDSTRALTWEEAAELWISFGGQANADSRWLCLPCAIPAKLHAGAWWVRLPGAGNERVGDMSGDLLEELAEQWGVMEDGARTFFAEGQDRLWSGMIEHLGSRAPSPPEKVPAASEWRAVSVAAAALAGFRDE